MHLTPIRLECDVLAHHLLHLLIPTLTADLFVIREKNGRKMHKISQIKATKIVFRLNASIISDTIATLPNATLEVKCIIQLTVSNQIIFHFFG